MSDSDLHHSSSRDRQTAERANGISAGVVQMIEDGRSCLDIAQQLHAVEKAIARRRRR